MENLLMNFSDGLAEVVERVARSVVRVEDRSRLTATGMIWNPDGVIVTTSHGVERDEDLAIELENGTIYPATLIGRDPDTDIAVLKVEATGLPSITRADAEKVRVGQLALALGRPGTSGLQATIGIVSARIDSQNGGREEYLLYTDAVLYPGFSGGPLLNMSGEVVGMNNLIYGRGKGVAIGAPILSHVVGALLQHGTVSRGYLGVRTQLVELPSALVASLSLPTNVALLLVGIEANGPADKSGLLPGDAVTGINGQAVSDVETLRNLLRNLLAGQVAQLDLLRGGTKLTVSVTLGSGG